MTSRNITALRGRLAEGDARRHERATERGRQVGAKWALVIAEPGELRPLVTLEIDGMDSAVPSLGLPVLAKLMDPDGEQRSYIRVLSHLADEGIGFDHQYVESPAFWDGFVRGALSAFWEAAG